MAETEAPVPLLSVEARQGSYWALSIGKLATLVAAGALSGVCLWFMWWQPAQTDELIARLGLGVPTANFLVWALALVAGICIAPTPKPVDHTAVAVAAVEDLDEMIRAQKTLEEDIAEVVGAISGGDDDRAGYRLATMLEELGRQTRMAHRLIARWHQVSPGSADEIVKGRAALQAILAKLEKEQGNG